MLRKLKFHLLWLLLLWPVLAGAEIPGSRDHPMIARYPGATIEWQLVENHREYRVPVGEVSGYRQLAQWIDTEGRLTRTYYALDGGGRSDREVYQNYRDALAQAGFELLAEGYVPEGERGAKIGSREWQDVIFRANPWGDRSGAVNEMARGSATAAGSGSIVARLQRGKDTAYVVVSVYQFRDNRVSTLVDVLEVAALKSGLIAVDAKAIGAGIREQGRVVLDGLFFDHDKATLTPQSAPVLTAIAEYLKSDGGRSFYVVGHTDAKGTLAYNLDLSKARAQAVVTALIRDHAIEAKRLDAHGLGPLSPRASNASDSSRERNRRVELVER